jgi:hypothetical protein
MRVVKVVGSSIALVAVLCALSSLDHDKADSFMSNNAPRKLLLDLEKVADQIPKETREKLRKFEKKEVSQEDLDGGTSDILCKEFGGIDHWNALGCCNPKCGTYCGSKECYKSKLGEKECCEGAFEKEKGVPKWCGKDQHAPCILNGSKVIDEMKQFEYHTKPFYAPGEKVSLLPDFSEDHAATSRRLLTHSFSISPALPDGLELNKETGAIKGAIPDDFAGGTYTVTAKNLAEQSTAKVSFNRVPKYPNNASFRPGGFVQLVPSMPDHGGTPSKWSVTPDLPDKLSLSDKGVIAGTLADDTPPMSQKYAITAENDAGRSTTHVTITVSVPAPGGFTYKTQLLKPSDTVDIKPKANTKMVDPTEWSIQPALLKGLKLDKKTGEISGRLTDAQPLGDFKFNVTAKNAAGQNSSPLTITVDEAPAKFSYGAAKTVAPGGAVEYPPEPVGAVGAEYTIEPKLINGLSIVKGTGVIQGSVTKDQADGTYKYTVTAKNYAATTQADFVLHVLNAPGVVRFGAGCANGQLECARQKLKIGMCEETLSAKSTGGKPDSFEINPKLPKGVSFNKQTAEITGKLAEKVKHDKEANFTINFTITARNAVGEKTTPITILFSAKECPSGGGFPIWLIILILLIAAAVIYYLCCRDTQEEKPKEYAPIPMRVEEPKPEPAPAPVAPPPPPPPRPVPVREFEPSLKLDFETPTGMRTVWAKRKPLGMVFEKVAPIKVNQERPESHALELGIKEGWILKKVNDTDISVMLFAQQDTILKENMAKLPKKDSIRVSLKWKDAKGEFIIVSAYKRPLALSFDKNTLPIKITKESEGHGKDIGVKVGWELVSVNDKDVSALNSYTEVEQVLKEEVDKLPTQ